ncbi:tudor domain-containing protein 15 [Archocentrus centrarchus]|uniref:tudor domain-containing protein 15 n=1 Tax=Archocentrus centrarchus TaxID=63155 RepID=UPI0011E9DA94|nr:tudor domain-containing protein 15 [Archocentrus centrarchus]XP_030576812.1 tudor domain-containing protein 15 [Archocentrus centrarchus]XP_030576813.1 tudor domain-containing protein 15 [Archocentrus centrarchus]XP_030576814.1 tudor domain-containing protein 15 [Archocentrus centrarchus]
MESILGSDHKRSQDSNPSAMFALWPVDLKLTHLDWNPEATLIHFQAQYPTICELDYSILQGEIQNVTKTEAEVVIGEFCLVEDLTSARWYRGRVQDRKDDLFDIFLIDHGNVLSVGSNHVSSCSNDLFILPPKMVCGFLANVLLLQSCSNSVVEEYFSSLIGRNVTGYIQALLPDKVLLLEAPDINSDLVRHGFGRHVDTDTFLLLVEMLTEMPLKQNKEPIPDLLIEKPRGQELCFRPGLQGYERIFSIYGPALHSGTCAKVRVTAAVSPRLFYCQMYSVEADLWEMLKKLSALFEYRAKESYRTLLENLDLLCTVKGKDGRWYRGFVPFLPVSSWVRVLFIDYGFFETVKVENIHRLPPELYSTPIMAFPCSLACLTDEDKVLKVQQLSLLKSGLLGGLLNVEITRYDEEHHVYCVTAFSAEDNRVKEPEPVRNLPVMKADFVPEAEKFSPQGGYLYHETIMGETLEQMLKVEEVQVGSVFVGYVEHVQNPNQFWIRTQKRNEEFEEMMSKMAEHFHRVKLDEDVLLNPKLGTLCCAVYEGDMHFYRGVVTDTLKHGAEVLFIDFGNIEKVPYMLVKNIPESFARKSAFAICCTLSNIFPLEDVWTSTACDFFRRAVSNKALLVHVLQMRKSKFAVDVFEMGSDNSRSIAELLVSSKQAEYIPIEHLAQNKAEKMRCPQSNERTNISGDKGQWKDSKEGEKACKNEPEKSPALSSIKALSIKPGCEFAVHCSYISSPSDLWCQPQDMFPALEELMDKIQKYYSAHRVPLQSGDSCCIAKSPHDERWYRALITEKQKDHATVMLVDCGRTIQVREHSLQAMMPEFVHLEGQAFRCSLYNLIEPAENSGDWSPEACRLLKDFVSHSNGALKCEVFSQLNVKNKGLCNVVDLYNIQIHQSVTETLIEHDLAKRVMASTKQHLAVFPESFIYSSHDLHPGSEEQVYVTHVNSQCEVYCHLERNTNIINELEKKISDESKKMTQASTRAVVRKLCLAKYFDGKWYRGMVHPLHSPLHLSVFFVDYGNTNISEKTNVMFIPRDAADLLHTPMQAVRCCLHSVSKEELYADVKEWLNEAVLNKEVKAVILGKNEDGSFDVELFDGDININEKVKELILSLSSKQSAISLSGKPENAIKFDMVRTTVKRKSYYKRNTETVFKYQNHPKGRNSYSSTPYTHRGTKETINNTKSLVSGRTQNKNTRVRAQNVDTSRTRYSVKSPNSQVKRQREAQEQPQWSKATEITQLLLDKKICAGFRAKCYISHIDSIYSFFLQLSEDEPAILKMGEALSSSTIRDSLKVPTKLRISEVVLAEFEEDGALYRSVVKNFAGSSCFKVEFVDYGNSAVVTKEKIFSIPKEHLSHPRFSIPCSLLDTSAFTDDASFTDAVMEKLLMVDFIQQCGSKWDVKMKVLDGEVGLNAALLTEKKNESPTSEATEKLRFHEQNNLEEEAACKAKIKSEKKMATVEGENVTPKPTPVKVSVKIRMKTLRHQRRRLTRTKGQLMKRFEDASFLPSVKARDTENGSILSVRNNGSFYVRLARTSDCLTALEHRIADSLYKCKMIARGDIKQGLKCLVQIQKGDKWHRAIVHHLNEENLEVFLVDHGITAEIPSGSIRQQCSDLLKIPNLAMLCRMNMLGFSEKDEDHSLWYETLKPMVGKEVRLIFLHYFEADDLWMVEIVINKLFLMQHVEGSLQQNNEKSPIPAESQNEDTEKGPTLDTCSPQQLVFAPVETNKSYSAFAAVVTTPFDFCVSLEHLLLIMSKVSFELDDLYGELTPLPEDHIAPGTCCLLKSDSKKKWCRAEIVHVDTTVVLNLVDYGHYECMPYDDGSSLKKLPSAITNLPKVAYPCILRGVKPVGVDGEWPDEAVAFFQQCLYEKNLQIFFREFMSNIHWKVDVLVDGVHVAKMLVDAGHASYVDVMLRLRFLEQRQSPDSEEQCGQEDEGSDEDEGTVALSTV